MVSTHDVFQQRIDFGEPGQLSKYSDGVTGWTTEVRFPQGTETFFVFATASRPDLGTTQPIKWVPGALSPEAI
jgi:hypothetical protein